MKTKSIIVTALLLVMALIGYSQTKSFLDQPYIEVSGSADTLLTPNEIFIKIITSERDTKDRISVEDLEIKMVNALQAIGIITETELETNDISSNYRFYLLKSKDVLKSKQYILKVKDAVTAGKVFITLEELGISNTSIDRTNNSEIEHVKNIMRTSAVQNAKLRAMALIKPLNQHIGPAIHIVDTENYNSNVSSGGLNEVIVMGYGVTRKSQVQDLPKIEFKKITITANVNVKFTLQ